MPTEIKAYHQRLLRALTRMVLGQEVAQTVPAQLKALAQAKVAMMIGCPF